VILFSVPSHGPHQMGVNSGVQWDKHRETEETSSLTDETEGVPPLDDDKKDVARYYLMKWTTEWEPARDENEEE